MVRHFPLLSAAQAKYQLWLPVTAPISVMVAHIPCPEISFLLYPATSIATLLIPLFHFALITNSILTYQMVDYINLLRKTQIPNIARYKTLSKYGNYLAFEAFYLTTLSTVDSASGWLECMGVFRRQHECV